MNDPATDKAVLLQCALHGKIVLMRVDAKVVTTRETMCKAKARHAASARRNRDAVDHAVGRIREPRAVLNDAIGGILSKGKVEYAQQLSLKETRLPYRVSKAREL